MSEIRVATRYAKSLFDLAEEKDLLDKMEGDVQGFLQVCESSRDFENMLKSPIIYPEKKWAVINKIFGHKVDEMMMTFIRIVVRKQREMILPEIFRQFMHMYKEKKNIITATMYTAIPVSERIHDDIRKFLEKETRATIELSSKVDQNVLGGFVLRYEDKLVDASVASQLKALRNHLINNN